MEGIGRPYLRKSHPGLSVRLRSTEGTNVRKEEKYIKRILYFLEMSTTDVTIRQKVHGNLNYATEVAPSGRPFLACLTDTIAAADQEGSTRFIEGIRAGLHIWLEILYRNRGISYNFVLAQLPRTCHDIVDATTD